MAEIADKLAQAFDFTPADLAANRNGRLTPPQQTLLAETRRLRGCGQRAAYFALAGTLLIFAAVTLFIAPLNSPELQWGVPYLVIGAVIFSGLFVGMIIWGQVRARDLKAGRISVAEGQATELSVREIKSKSGSVLGTAYCVKIGQTRFRLATQAQFKAFEPGVSYRVFYVKDPPIHLILSVESVSC